MLELHEAAKIITESVDPNAKIIFGISKDEKLKKGEVKVTVIATGFPASGIVPKGLPLFAFGRDGKEKDVELPMGKAFPAPAVTTPPPAKEKEKEAVKPVIPEADTKQPKKIEVNDDDEWGAVPSFLRRPKIK